MEKNFEKNTSKKRGRPKKNSGGKTMQAKTGKQKSSGKKT